DLAKIREAIQPTTGGPAVTTDGHDGGTARTEEIGATATYPAPALQTVEPRPRAEVRRIRSALPAVAAERADGQAQRFEVPRPRSRGILGTAAAATGLCAGGLAGWAARAPDIQSLPDDSSQHPPVLWIEPRWSAIPKQGGPEDQYRYAQFTAPRD